MTCAYEIRGDLVRKIEYHLMYFENKLIITRGERGGENGEKRVEGLQEQL